MQEGLGGAALSAGTTFTGALANVKAALSRLGETAATPVLDGLRGLFNQAIPLIDTFTAAVTPTLQKVGAALQQGLENAIPATQAKLKTLATRSPTSPASRCSPRRRPASKANSLASGTQSHHS